MTVRIPVLVDPGGTRDHPEDTCRTKRYRAWRQSRPYSGQQGDVAGSAPLPLRHRTIGRIEDPPLSVRGTPYRDVRLPVPVVIPGNRDVAGSAPLPLRHCTSGRIEDPPGAGRRDAIPRYPSCRPRRNPRAPERRRKCPIAVCVTCTSGRIDDPPLPRSRDARPRHPSSRPRRNPRAPARRRKCPIAVCVTAPVEELRIHQCPVEGRHTATSVFPSPS